VYPAAGMLVMAIEAANQMADPTQKTIGFELKETSFLRSLTIPQDTSGIETQLSLHLLEETFTTSNSWAEFRLCAFENSQWHECCRGSIRVEYQAVSNNFDEGQEKSEELRMGVDVDSSIGTACQSRMDPVALYESLNNNGFGFGPAFQPISNASFGADNESHANIRLFEWPPKQFPQPHIVHPTSLDGMLHLAIAGYAKGGELPVPTMIPTLLRSLWISKHGLNNSENSSVRASAWMVAEDNRGTEFDASILNPEKTAILAQIRGLRLTIIADATAEALEPQTRQVCYHIDCLPDLDLLTSGQHLNHSRVDKGQQLEKSKLQEATLSLALSFLRRALTENIKTPTQTLTPQLEAYTQWASAHLESSSGSQGDALASSSQLGVIDEPTFESLCHSVEGSGAEGQYFVAIGRNLPRILRGEIDIPGILDQLRAPVDFGGKAPSETPYHDDFTTYSNLLGHKNPNLRILEVSSGPNEMIYRFMEGNATKNPQDQQHNFRYGTYHYTNISQLYIDQVRENLAQYPRLTIGTLDLEGDLQSQGYEAGNYDIIFATNIFSRTQDPGRALRNASMLLSPGGRLVANEPRLPTSLQSGFITGLVSSWWMDTKDWTETDSMKQWQQLFTNNGFMPFDLEIPDHLAGFGQQSFLVARASTTSVKTRQEQSLVFIRDPGSSIQNDLSEGLRERFKSIPSIECSSTDMLEHATLPNISQTIFVVLLELDRPFLYNLSEGEYPVLKQFLMSSKDIVWINPYGGSAIDKPEFALASGLARALRNEYEEHRFTTLALDFHDTISEKQVEQVYDIILRNHVYENTSDCEPEYIEIDGRLNIQRLVHVPQLDTEIYTRSLPQQSTTITIADAPPIYLTIRSPGLLDTLHFVEDKIYYEPLDDDEVEIQIQAVGMNFKDCLIALGQVPGNTFGLECSGIVTRAGKDTGLVPGERLVMAAPGSFRTFTRGKAAASYKIPDEMSFIEAASILAQFGTAWEVLHKMARIQKGETVLIHAAAGGTGQAAIQIAQFLGAIVFATVGSQEKKKLLNEEYGIPEDHIFFSRDTSFAKGIKRVTKGRGVDVIINSLAGESLRASWDCIASYGRFVEIGKKDVVSNANLPMLSFGKNASFMGFDASIWQKERPLEANRDLKILVDLFANKTFHTARPLHVHNISNIEGVFRIMQNGKSSGKIVLEVTPSSQISVSEYSLTRPRYFVA
jgi:NADPH:quinone reductase-like Zn-dependent oxidoreductase